MLSIVHEDKVLDFHYKQSKSESHMYNFYVGDIFVGQLFKLGKHNWYAVSFYKNYKGGMGGFGSRYHASEFLLKVNKFYKDEVEALNQAFEERVKQLLLNK